MRPIILAHPSASNTVQLSPKMIPTGEKLKLSSADALLAWLEKHMKDKQKLASRANLLSSESMEFTLEGRQQSMEIIQTSLKTIYESATKDKHDRMDYPFPVCSAMSGIGKTRLLDEWVKKLKDDANIWCDINFPPTEQRLALVLSYGNGHSVVSEERSMGAHAGFAWRLLFAIFLERNNKFNGWYHFWTSLPMNADQFRLGDVFKVIQKALGLNDEDTCALFVGIDECQRIPTNHVDGEDALVNFLDAKQCGVASHVCGYGLVKDVIGSLELNNNQGNYVLIVDQHKRAQGHPNIPEAINKAYAVHKNHRWQNVQHVVVALFSMFTIRDLDSLPQNSIAATFDQHKTYHGALHLHPAATACVCVNFDNQAALVEGLFHKSARAGAQKIFEDRIQGRRIDSFENLKSVLGNDADNLWNDAVDLCSFFC